MFINQELAKLADIPEENEIEGSEELDKHSRQFLKYAKQIRQMKVGFDAILDLEYCKTIIFQGDQILHKQNLLKFTQS